MKNEVFVTSSEDGIFVFKDLELAKRSWVLTYSRIGTVEFKEDSLYKTIVVFNKCIIGFIHRTIVRNEPDHL